MDISKEKREAIEAGKRALHSLHHALDKLNDASTWGMFDMLGGGFFTSMAKRSRMSAANQDLQQAQRDLNSFANELQDLSAMYDFNFQFDGFLSFADMFMDNMFVDMMVQNQINQAKNSVQSAITKVESILLRLGDEF